MKTHSGAAWIWRDIFLLKDPNFWYEERQENGGIFSRIALITSSLLFSRLQCGTSIFFSYFLRNSRVVNAPRALY
jgi:hypothetical protein